MTFIKRAPLSTKQQILINLGCVLFGMILVTVFLMVFKLVPLEVFSAMLIGNFGTTYRITEMLSLASMIILASIGIAFAFKMKFINIGGEGQIIMGGVFASFIALSFKSLPGLIMIPLMIVMAFVGGALWALIATIIKVKFEVNETIVTLMLNYIAIQLVLILQQGIWKDPQSLGYPKVSNFVTQALFTNIFGIPVSFMMAFIAILFSIYFIHYSKKGFEMAVIGERIETARYAGINIHQTIIQVMVLSGGLCGLVGFIQVSSHLGTLNTQIGAGIGFTAVMVAWISKLKPSMIVVTSIGFACLQQGAMFMESTMNVSSSISLMIQGLILFCVLGSELFKSHRLVLKRGDLK